ncbi:hypothetical protein RND81_08G010300 [Saponaria officinalis]|uniref:Uncharacterized protein n=1 Tax=Saponaria officinalis TaxID=3572 RepID=A0AAW1J1L1_SAPOF
MADEAPPPPSQSQQQPITDQHVSPPPDSSPHLPKFDPTRMIGIIKRKALIKDLAAVYHAECLDYCQELLTYQRKWEETYNVTKVSEDLRRDSARATKRVKKVR